MFLTNQAARRWFVGGNGPSFLLVLSALLLAGPLATKANSATPSKARIKKRIQTSALSVVRVRSYSGNQSRLAAGVLMEGAQPGTYEVRCTWHQVAKARKIVVYFSHDGEGHHAKVHWKRPDLDQAGLIIKSPVYHDTVALSDRQVFDETPVYVIVPTTLNQPPLIHAGRAHHMVFTKMNAQKPCLNIKATFENAKPRKGWSGSPVFDARTGDYLGPIIGTPIGDDAEPGQAYFGLSRRDAPKSAYDTLAKMLPQASRLHRQQSASSKPSPAKLNKAPAEESADDDQPLSLSHYREKSRASSKNASQPTPPAFGQVREFRLASGLIITVEVPAGHSANNRQTADALRRLAQQLEKSSTSAPAEN